MKRNYWLLWILLASGLVALALGYGRYVGQDPVKQAKDIDRFLTELQKLNKFNGTALVSNSGKVIHEKGYGIRRGEENLSHDHNSIFRIYSITKPFTSVLILQLVSEGKLALTDQLSKYYPHIVNADRITIEHLLSHCSGLYDYTREISFENSEANLTKLLQSKPSDFEPGKGWNYCNSGYCLLGYIIEQVTKKSYADNLRLRIFEPLQMHHSGFDFKNLTGPDISVGYRQINRTNKVKSSVLPSSGPFAAGGIHATAHDLYLFHLGLRDNRLVTRNDYCQATRGCKNNSNYGLGWQIQRTPSFLGGNTKVWHGGGADGFRSCFSQDSKFERCVIVLSNVESTNAEYVSDSIHKILDGGKISIPPVVDVAQSVLEKYVGLFKTEDNHPLLIKTSIIDGLLAVEIIGQSPNTLLAKSQTTFVQLEANATLSFDVQSDGAVQKIRIKRDGNLTSMVAKRMSGNWGLIGDALPGGWQSSSDVELSRSSTHTDVWTIESVRLSQGELKFRFANDWNYNFGDQQQDGTLELFGSNISVQAGVYRVELDLSGTSPHYTLERLSD